MCTLKPHWHELEQSNHWANPYIFVNVQSLQGILDILGIDVQITQELIKMFKPGPGAIAVGS